MLTSARLFSFAIREHEVLTKRKNKKRKKAERDEWKKRNSMAEILSLFASSVREKYKVQARYRADSLIHDNC